MSRDKELNIVHNLLHLSDKVQPLILVTKDECKFNSNNKPHYICVHRKHKAVLKKCHGQGLYVLDFLTPMGRLGNRDAVVIIKGRGNVWLTGDSLLE